MTFRPIPGASRIKYNFSVVSQFEVWYGTASGSERVVGCSPQNTRSLPLAVLYMRPETRTYQLFALVDWELRRP
jgi:hypothetical protein